MGNTLRELQLCELQILKDVKRVCERHGFRYYLTAGTLLGAVRHKGFIPWDDDIDIIMPYPDYVRFLEVAQKELGDGYFVQNSDTDPLYSHAYTHIRKNNTTMVHDWERKIHSHHGVWLDVFPMVYVNSMKEHKIKNMFLRVCFFLHMDDELFLKDQQWYRDQSNSVVFLFVKLARKLPRGLRYGLRNRILRWIYENPKGKYMCFIWTNVSELVPSEVYEGDPAILPFEDDTYPAARDFDRYLTLAYGDYMTPPPPEKRNGGHGEFEIIDLERDWTYYCD